jgi:hypothetical protein
MMNDLIDADWGFNYNIVHISSLCSNFVFVNPMVAAPVVDKHYGIPAHTWSVTAATTYVVNRIWSINGFWHDCCLWHKPNAGFTFHPV